MRKLYSIVLVGVLFGLVGFVKAEERRFNIDSIPDQKVWHGSSLTFLVHWEDHNAGSFDVLSSPEPFGPISMRPSTEEGVWKFDFVPNQDDKFPFHVIITASDGDDSISQAFDVIPLAKLKPEMSVFDAHNHTKPVYVERVILTEKKSPLPEHFNHVDRSTYQLSLIGENVVFDAQLEDDDQLYTSFHERENIRDLTIIAEKLIIRSHLRLYGTNVTIYAKEMVFEGDGRIDTRPMDTTAAPAQANPPVSGVNGEHGGRIVLNVGDFSAPADAFMLFDTSGGTGQSGSPGQSGAAGYSVPGGSWTTFEMGCGSIDTCGAPFVTYTATDGYRVIYFQRNGGFGVVLCTSSANSEADKPGDGLPATAGGKPGYGGSAGNMTATFDVSAYARQERGNPGTSRVYYGGWAGSPSKWVRVYWECAPATVKTETKGTTVAGADANDPAADVSPFPETGSFSQIDNPYAWLNPLMVSKILKTARADYLDSQFLTASSKLVQYAEIVLAYMQDEEAFASLDDTTQVELGKSYDEMEILLQQMESGNDYFGNPAGWVPMLSFEVNASIFDQEIDHALNLLYLTYWIGKNAELGIKTVETLEAARDVLKEELASAIQDYDAAVAIIPVLRVRGIDMETRTIELQQLLQVTEENLIAQAKQNTMPPWWEIALRTGAKTAAMVCKMIPVYQPYLGAVGGGISLLSDFDADQPWESVMDVGIGGVDVFAGCLDSRYNSALAAQQNAIKKVDPTSEASLKIAELKKMRNSSQALSAGLTDLRGYLSNLEAPADEIAAELEKLKSESDEFKQIIEDIEDILELRGELINELATAMRDVSILPTLISQDILELDAMGDEITHINDALDDRTIMYVKDMEERANQRLLKYHYFMAKAYEYRLLRPYLEPLDLTDLRNKLIDIGSIFDPDFISSDDFQSFKALYQEKLALVAKDIFESYNSNRPEVSAPVRFELNQEELDQINRGESVILNLMDLGLFSSEDENIRIVDIAVFQATDGSYEITTEPVSEEGYGSTAYVDIKIEHSGISRIKSNGDVYRFAHYTQSTTNPIVWGARYDPVNNVTDPIRPSAASESLLQALLPDIDLSDLMIYSRPSAWAELRLYKTENNNNSNINITKLKLELTYDFSTKNEELGLVELDVRVAKKDYDAHDVLSVSEASFTPYFLVEMPDVNQRQDARGKFMRFFPSSLIDSVGISAQPAYGNWEFRAWTDAQGNEISTDTTIDLDLADNQIVFAYYELDDYPMPNHSPSAPLLVSPLNKARNIGDKPKLVWEASTDPDLDPVSYFVTLCDNAAFDNCEPIGTTATQTQEIKQAAFSGPSAFAALGLVLALIGFSSRKRRLAFLLVMLLSLGLFATAVSCGNGGSGAVSGPTDYQPDTALEAETTYYWKVIATDGRGGLATSDTWSFTTD